MKKLLSLVLALSMVMSLGCFVLADDNLPDYGKLWDNVIDDNKNPDSFVDIAAYIPQEGYVAGDAVDVILNITAVSLGQISLSNNNITVSVDDGVSTLAFDLCYNKALVTPAPLAEVEAESEAGNATALMTSNPGWEGMGKIDSENGKIDLSFGDISSAALREVKVVNGKNLQSFQLTVPFVVNEGVTEEDIVFSFENVIAYNLDATKYCFPEIESVKIIDAINLPQLPEKVELPANAFEITHAGYIYEAGVTFVYYAAEEITLSELVFAAMGEHASQDFNYYGAIICDENGVVTAVNSTLGRPAGVKGDTVIPAGSFLLSVNGHSKQFAAVESVIKVGSVITLYNVNINGTYVTNGAIAMEKAGFTVYNEMPVQPENPVALPSDAIKLTNAGYIHAAGAAVIMATQTETTLGALAFKGDAVTLGSEEPDMNYWGVIIADENGVITYVNNTLGRPAGVKTDVPVPAGSIVIGIHGGNAAMGEAEIGQKIELYNIDTDAVARLLGNKPLTDAGFRILSAGIELAEGAPAVYNEEGNFLKVYTSSLDSAAFNKLFTSEVEILDKDGEALTKGLVSTGMTVNGVLIIIAGDVNGDGKVAANDYALVKRTVLKTHTLQGNEILAADVNGNGKIDAADYGMLKRSVLKTYNLSDLLK